MARGIIFGLLAAALFGASAPLAKLLLPESGSFLLAGLFYLGAGAGLLALRPFRERSAAPTIAELRPMLVMVTAGGIAGPVLLMLGLARVSGVAGALLLTLETPLTILLAVAAFHEHLSRREAFGALLVIAGGAALAWAPGVVRGDLRGVLAIAGACACWAIDNNAAQKVSLRDPITVVIYKAVPAGLVNLSIALLLSQRIPKLSILVLALLTGAICYGASLAFNLVAVRHLGAARQSVLFATAPFVGALLAVPLLRESLRGLDLFAAAVMAAGLVYLLRSRHSHTHVHEAVVHEHLHTHDSHHQHSHEGPIQEPHTHAHEHDRMEHEHDHLPDAHHRHGHH